MKSKIGNHTPGPWQVIESVQGDVSIFAKTGRVARVVGPGNGVIDANAAVIATAPDMKKELENISALADRFVNGTRVFSSRTGQVRPPSVRDLKELLRAIRDGADAVIDKSEGD